MREILQLHMIAEDHKLVVIKQYIDLKFKIWQF